MLLISRVYLHQVTVTPIHHLDNTRNLTFLIVNNPILSILDLLLVIRLPKLISTKVILTTTAVITLTTVDNRIVDRGKTSLVIPQVT